MITAVFVALALVVVALASRLSDGSFRQEPYALKFWYCESSLTSRSLDSQECLDSLSSSAK